MDEEPGLVAGPSLALVTLRTAFMGHSVNVST